jgi:uncharacterized protein YjaZ
MNTITYTILNSSGSFNEKQITTIKTAFARAEHTVSALLKNAPNTDMVFYDNPQETNDKVGVGGQTMNEHTVFVPLDSSFPFTEDEIYVTICHELHHCARLHAVGRTDTLLDTVVMEGTGEQFEKEVLPSRTLITYNKSVTKKQISESLAKLKKVITSGKYNYGEWFLGEGMYPKWYGYALGNYIVEQYGKANGLKPSDMTSVRVEDFELFIQRTSSPDL